MAKQSKAHIETRENLIKAMEEFITRGRWGTNQLGYVVAEFIFNHACACTKENQRHIEEGRAKAAAAK